MSIYCPSPNLKVSDHAKVLYLFLIGKVGPLQYLAFTHHSFNISLSKGDFSVKEFLPFSTDGLVEG